MIIHVPIIVTVGIKSQTLLNNDNHVPIIVTVGIKSQTLLNNDNPCTNYCPSPTPPPQKKIGLSASIAFVIVN